MGTRETKICDVCKVELPYFPMFNVGKVTIALSKQGWGNYDQLAHFEGELCGECTAIINRAAEAFHRELQQRLVKEQPGDRISKKSEPTPAPALPAKKRGKRGA